MAECETCHHHGYEHIASLEELDLRRTGACDCTECDCDTCHVEEPGGDRED